MTPPRFPRAYEDADRIICGPYAGREQPYTVWRRGLGADWSVERFTATLAEARAVWNR